MAKISHAFEMLLKRGKARTCLIEGEDCTRTTIQAHSVQNSTILEQIVDTTGHVYTFKTQPSGLALSRLGRNKATTFSGLCNHHDTQLFREIDFSNQSIPTVFTPRQKTLFFLRALLLEGWKKQSIVNSLGDIAKGIEAKDALKVAALLNVSEKEIVDTLVNPEPFAWSIEGNIKGLDEFRAQSRAVFGQLRSGKFHNTVTHHWRLRSRIEAVVTTGFTPIWDLEGTHLYDLSKMPPRMSHMSLTVFPDGEFVNVFISHHRLHQARLQKLMDQIGKHFSKATGWQDWLTEFMLEHSENIVMRPSFIEALKPTERDALEKAVRWTSTDSRPPETYLPFCFFSKG